MRIGLAATMAGAEALIPGIMLARPGSILRVVLAVLLEAWEIAA